MIRRFFRWLFRRVARDLFETKDVSESWLRADRLAQGKMAIAPPDPQKWLDRPPAPWPDDPAHRQHRRLRRVK